jgi:integrase
MPLTLIPPGKRKGNRFYIARGKVGERDIEVSTKTRDKAAARRFAQELERRLIASDPPRPGEAVTFAAAADIYIAYRDPSATDRRHIGRLKRALGTKLVGDIRQADLVAAADLLAPGLTAATRNRKVLRMAAAILHYAAENDYCDWRRVKLFKEPEPQTRAVSMDVAAELIMAAPEGRQRLLLLWLFRQGTRISQTLSVSWPDIDLPQQTFRLYDKKGQRWRTFPLHPEVFEELAAIPEPERTARPWPWKEKMGVYRWLTPLTKKLGISFTPHMARHSLGTWLNQSGAGIKTIMAALGHQDVKSSLRYQAADIEIVRAATKKLGEFMGKTSRSRRNTEG